MSTSEAGKRVRLEVRSSDKAAEIFVIDRQFRLANRGVGKIDVMLTPGIYKVKVRAGFEAQEEFVVLGENDQEVVKDFPPLKFSSPIPLAGTAKTNEAHTRAAEMESRKVHLSSGQGSSIFVFAHDWTADEKPADAPQSFPHPARWLMLRSLDGNLVADVSKESKSDLSWDPWAACNVQVDPGVYLLCLEMPSGDTLQQPIVAAAGWQTQIFLLQQGYGKEKDRRADLPGGSILLARGQGFDPLNLNGRLVELARLGLTNERKVLSEEVRAMLSAKFENPMLGIYGAHLLLLDEKPDFALFNEVINNLRGLLGHEHPDAEALALMLEPNEGSYVFKVPPMLRRSWSLVLIATAKRPQIVPRDSLSYAVAERLWGSGPWVFWLRKAENEEGPPSSSAQKEAQLTELEAALHQLLPILSESKKMSGQDEGPDEGASSSKTGLKGIGGVVTSLVDLLLAFAHKSAPSLISNQQVAPGLLLDVGEPVRSATVSMVRPLLDDEDIQHLIRIFGIPRAGLEDLLDQIERKTEHNTSEQMKSV